MELRNILHELFPTGSVGRCRRDSFEVAGLPRGSEPKQGDILARGPAKSVRPGERRETYLVRAHGALLYFRIRSADPVSGSGEVVEGLDVAFTTEGQEALEKRARSAIGLLRR